TARKDHDGAEVRLGRPAVLSRDRFSIEGETRHRLVASVAGQAFAAGHDLFVALADGHRDLARDRVRPDDVVWVDPGTSDREARRAGTGVPQLPGVELVVGHAAMVRGPPPMVRTGSVPAPRTGRAMSGRRASRAKRPDRPASRSGFASPA